MRIRKTREQKLEKLLGAGAKHVDIAISIGERVTASLVDANQNSSDVTGAYERAVKQLEEDERQRQLASVFEELPASKRFAILRGLFPDDATLSRVLEDQRIAALEVEARQTAQRSLSREAWLNHHVDLSLIPQDMQVQIGLFQGSTFRLYGDDHSRYLQYAHQAHTMTFSSLGESVFRFVHERRDYMAGTPVPELQPMQEVRLSTVSRFEDGPPSSLVHFNDRLVCDIDSQQSLVEHTYRGGGQPEHHREYIALLALDGQQLFGSNIAL